MRFRKEKEMLSELSDLFIGRLENRAEIIKSNSMAFHYLFSLRFANSNRARVLPFFPIDLFAVMAK